MQYRQWVPNERLPQAKRSVALGVFDGVHVGHRAVISLARNVKPVNGEPPLTLTVFSLDGVPKAGGRLLTQSQIVRQAKTLSVDEWLCVPFASVRDFSPQEFVNSVLYEQLNTQVVCCGSNFRFGKNGAGDAMLLRTLCEPLGIEVRIVPVVERDNVAISTTEIRHALAAGDPVRVLHLLGRPYAVGFPVSAGNHVGAAWGYPTVNQPIPAEFTCPRFGVYASLVTLDDVQYRAITNVGVHPTVGDTAMPQAETHIMDYSGDLYGREIEVELIRFLREERQFDSVEELKMQIACDVATAADLLDGKNQEKAILFDFDDTLQHRPNAFSATVRELTYRYRPDWETEEREAFVQWATEKNNGGYVDYNAYAKEVCARGAFDVPWETLLRELRLRFPFYSELFPDAVSVLAELRDRGYRLGLITNGGAAMQNQKVDHAAIRPYFDVVVICGYEGVQKPCGEVFLRAARRLCTAPERCVYVGDYPPNDIVGARNAGMTPLYIDVFGRNQCPDGVEQVTSLTQLLDIFK